MYQDFTIIGNNEITLNNESILFLLDVSSPKDIKIFQCYFFIMVMMHIFSLIFSSKHFC